MADSKEAEAELRELTPLLITGPDGSNTVIRKGPLTPGLEGTLCEHVFDDGGARQKSTIVLMSVPETVAYVPALVCRDRASLGGENPAQLPAERWQPVDLESVAFNGRYHLLTLAGQDQGWVRELFSPELISWLTVKAPSGLSFELNEGNLVVAVPGPTADPAAVDVLVGAAAELRARISREALEEESDPDIFDESAEIAAVVETMKVVDWKNPPESVGEAKGRYARSTRWKSGVLITAAFWGTVMFALTLVVFALVLDIFFSFAAAVFIALIPAVFAGIGTAAIGQWVPRTATAGATSQSSGWRSRHGLAATRSRASSRSWIAGNGTPTIGPCRCRASPTTCSQGQSRERCRRLVRNARRRRRTAVDRQGDRLCLGPTTRVERDPRAA